jgi:hypothetical protein
VVVFDHSLPARQRINDRVDTIVKEPLHPLRVLLSRSYERELVEQLIRDELRGSIKVALFPRALDLPSVSAQATGPAGCRWIGGSFSGAVGLGQILEIRRSASSSRTAGTPNKRTVTRFRSISVPLRGAGLQH